MYLECHLLTEKHIMKHTSLILAIVLFTFKPYAQEDELISTLQANTFTLDFKEGNAGFDLLSEAIKESQFTMIAEAHGLAEVQAISTNLYDIGAGAGYSAMVIETDPFSAAKVSQLARVTDGETYNFAQRYPMAIPFFHSEEGMAMARHIAEKGGEFWGVDQVFVVGPRYLFTKLAKVAETHEANNLAAEYADRAQQAFEQAMASQKPGEVLLMQLTDEDFDKLRKAFAGQESAVEMIDQMQLSRDIYQYWYDGEYYLNNSVRSDLMKRLFMEQYNRAAGSGNLPKVMFKLGSNHAVRGLTSTHIYDLGNLVSELAAINGTKSLHIRLTGARGSSYNMLAGAQEFDAVKEWHPWLAEALSEQLESSGGEFLLVDFRPLRKLSVKSIDPDLRDLIFANDMWIIIRNAHPVTPIEG